MQITAKLIQTLPLQTGQGKNGEWRKQDIIVETSDQYPKKICFSVWGNKINQEQLKIGNELQVDFDIESKEYNGKWFTEAKAWKISAVSLEGFIIPVKKNIENSDDEILPF
ncbi:MAG: DUF3127 domain-containing protein [Saprospiraceae bacterium]